MGPPAANPGRTGRKVPPYWVYAAKTASAMAGIPALCTWDVLVASAERSLSRRGSHHTRPELEGSNGLNADSLVPVSRCMCGGLSSYHGWHPLSQTFDVLAVAFPRADGFSLGTDRPLSTSCPLGWRRDVAMLVQWARSTTTRAANKVVVGAKQREYNRATIERIAVKAYTGDAK